MKRNLIILGVALLLAFCFSSLDNVISQTGGYGKIRKLDPKTGYYYGYQPKANNNPLTTNPSPIYALPSPTEQRRAVKQLENRVVPLIQNSNSRTTRSNVSSSNAVPTSAVVERKTTVLDDDKTNQAIESSRKPQTSETEKVAETVPVFIEPTAASDPAATTESITEAVVSEPEQPTVVSQSETPSVEISEQTIVAGSAEPTSENLPQQPTVETGKVAETVPAFVESTVVSQSETPSVETSEQSIAADSIELTSENLPQQPVAVSKTEVVEKKSGLNSDIQSVLNQSPNQDDPAKIAVDEAMNGWQKSVEKIGSIKNSRSDANYSVARYNPQESSSNSNAREDFLNMSPDDFDYSKPETNALSDLTSLPTPSSTTNPENAAQPNQSSQASRLSGSNVGAAINYGSMIDVSEISAGPNDIIVNNGSVQIPTGEGYNAKICSNSQGLLVQLGLEVLDAEGKPVLDENGKAKLIPLKRGMKVQKGQILARQKDDELVAKREVAQFQLVVAQMEADKELEIEVADSAALVAKSSYYRAKAANDDVPGAITPEEMTEKAFDWKRSEKAAEKARYDLEVKKHEVQVANAQLSAADTLIEDKKLVCPIDGVIDDITKNEGEWLREGDDVLHVIRLDKVQIQGRLDASRYTPEMIDGKNVTVYVKKPGASLQTLEGKVTYVRQFIEASSYSFYCDVENKMNEKGYWLLNPEALVVLVVHQ